jgi:PPOX class probable F420-dependent enzyme
MIDFPQSHRDLLQSQIAVLGTLNPDGFPQVSALWFVFHDGTITLSLNDSRQKTKNLQRRPECTLLLIDPVNPYRTMEIRARADVAPDTDHVAVTLVQEKYGADVREHDGPGQNRMIVRLTPVKINTWG